MSNLKVETMHETVMNFLGKNLFHSMDTNMMYWTDILSGQVFSMDLNNQNRLHMFKLMGEKTISFCVPIHGKKDQFIVGAGRRLLHVTWDGIHTMGQIVKVLCEIPVNGVRINQFIVDKQGRLLFGTMLSEEHGDVFDMKKHICCLYRYTMQDGLVMLKDKLGMANGMAFNNAYTKLWFTDSYDLMIHELDYDMKTGNLGTMKTLIDMTHYGQVGKIFLGALTVDHEDHLYMLLFGGGKILKVDTKTKKVEQEIKLIVEQPTGLEFGGKHLDTLYVTSAAKGLHHEQTYPAGYLMKISNLGTTGVHMHKFVM
jgi:sugar lactone lactonase YvrE